MMYAMPQRMELESVKRERAGLLQSLASLKADQGKSGRDLQSDDIRRLRKEMELKKDKVNELRQVRISRMERHVSEWVRCHSLICFNLTNWVAPPGSH